MSSTLLFDTLETDSSVVYVLDKHLHIEYCNQAWDDFARANGGAELLRPNIIGKAVLDYIDGPLKLYYQKILSRILNQGGPWEHSYECSSPQVLRLFRMRILRLPDSPSLLVVNSLEVEKPHDREPSEREVAAYRNAAGQIIMCSGCRRTLRNGEPRIWDWVPALLERSTKDISHGLCSVCLAYYYSSEFES